MLCIQYKCKCKRKCSALLEKNRTVALEDKHKHTSEKEHDDDRVDEREPVDLNVAHGEVDVPARRPTDIARQPNHLIRVRDLLLLLYSTTQNIME